MDITKMNKKELIQKVESLQKTEAQLKETQDRLSAFEKRNQVSMEESPAELLSTQLRFKDFVDSSSNSVSVWKAPNGFRTDLPIEDQIEMFYNSICIEVNDRFLKGRNLTSKDEVIGIEFDDLIRERTYEDIFTEFIKNNYQITKYEFIDVLPNGENVIFRQSWHGLGEDGILTYFWVITEDVTERRQVEDTLQENEKNLSLIYETTGDVLYQIGVEGDGNYRFLSVNNAFIEATGLTREIIEGKTIDQVIPEPSLTLVRRYYAEAIKNKKTIRWEETTEYPTGVKIGSVAISPAFNNQGICTHLVGSVHDITDRVQAEERFSSILRLAPDGILSIDEYSRITLFNQGAEILFGYKAKEVIGKPLHTLMPGKYQKIHQKHVAGFGKDKSTFSSRMGQRQHLEIIGKRKNGEVFPIEVSISKFTLGKEILFFAIIRDISERKAAEISIKHAKERLEEAQSIANLGNWEWNINTNKNIWSNQTYLMFGYEPGEIEPTFDLFISHVHPDDRKAVIRANKQALKFKEKYDVEFRIISAKNEELILHSLGDVHSDADGKPHVMVGVFHDITARKKAEIELVAHKEDLERIVEERTEKLSLGEARAQLLKDIATTANTAETTNIAIWKIVKKVAIFLGWPIGHAYVLAAKNPGELEAADIWYLKHPRKHKPFKDATPKYKFQSGSGLLGRVLENKRAYSIEDICIEEHFQRREEASEIGLRGAFGFPVIVNNEVAAVLEFFSFLPEMLDQTMLDIMDQIGVQLGFVIERFNAEAAMEEARVAAEEANLAKSKFLANMSHELRTPLNAINGFSEVLLEKYYGDLNPKQEEYVHDILESGNHLLSLINDILDLSKIEAGKEVLELSSVDFSNLLENSLVMIKEKAIKHNIELDIKIPKDLLNFQIKVDQRKIKQVMFNLLSNATKFTPEGGKISIEAAKIKDEIQVSVTDTGIGIKKDKLGNLFAEFYQIRNDKTAKQKGTGLGLSLVKRYIEMHGGKAWVESEGTGKGSTFSFTLPIRQNPQSK